MDTLLTRATEAVPDAGTRITGLVVVAFVVAILITLLYLRMKEHDQNAGIN